MHRIVPLCFIIACGLVAQDKPATDSKPSTSKALEVTVPSYANPNCPLMSKPSKDDIWVDSSHGRVYLCCKNCLARAKKDPDVVYAKAFPSVTKVNNKVDPISGKPVKDGATVVYMGYEIALEDASHGKKVVENGDVIVTLLTKPEVKDVRNEKDPITNSAVVANTFVLIGDSLVHLSSTESVEKVKKDPAKALEAAQKTAKPDKKGD